MTLQSALVMFALLVWIASQYGLAAWALRDLRDRRGFRSGNRVSWAFVILCLPIAGPLLYAQLARNRGIAARRRAVSTTPRRTVARDSRPASTPPLDDAGYLDWDTDTDTDMGLSDPRDGGFPPAR